MTDEAAEQLIQGAVGTVQPHSTEVWADLGAGTGTFTRALANLLGDAATVYAIEQDQASLKKLVRSRDKASRANSPGAKILAHHADFTTPLALPALSGILLANSLHFIPYDAQAQLIHRLLAMLKAQARLVIVEYNRERGNQWVPYPVSAATLRDLAQRAGLQIPQIVSTIPSAFGGEMYCGYMFKETVSDAVQ